MRLPPYLGKGVMLMDFGSIVSLAGLLIATVSLLVDVISLIVSMKRESGPHRPPPKD
jgi:hypothetical protein